MRHSKFVIITLLVSVLGGCSIDEAPPVAGPAEQLDPPGVSSIEGDIVERARTDITQLQSLLKQYNENIDTVYSMEGCQIYFDEAMNAFCADNGAYRIGFRLEEDGTVTSAYYLDGLAETDKKAVSLALAKILAPSDNHGGLKVEAYKKRIENDSYAQELVDVIEGFGGSSSIPSLDRSPEVELDASELSRPGEFTEQDLHTPEVSSPSAAPTPKNPAEPNLPSIGNFGKIPD